MVEGEEDVGVLMAGRSAGRLAVLVILSCMRETRGGRERRCFGNTNK